MITVIKFGYVQCVVRCVTKSVVPWGENSYELYIPNPTGDTLYTRRKFFDNNAKETVENEPKVGDVVVYRNVTGEIIEGYYREDDVIYTVAGYDGKIYRNVSKRDVTTGEDEKHLSVFETIVVPFIENELPRKKFDVCYGTVVNLLNGRSPVKTLPGILKYNKVDDDANNRVEHIGSVEIESKTFDVYISDEWQEFVVKENTKAFKDDAPVSPVSYLDSYCYFLYAIARGNYLSEYENFNKYFREVGERIQKL